MSGTAARRTFVALLVTALVAVAYVVATASSRPTPAGAAEPTVAAEEQPEIGTALLLVRNADGSVTATERR